MALSCVGLSRTMSKERSAFVFCFILCVCECVHVFVCLIWRLFLHMFVCRVFMPIHVQRTGEETWVSTLTAMVLVFDAESFVEPADTLMARGLLSLVLLYSGKRDSQVGLPSRILCDTANPNSGPSICIASHLSSPRETFLISKHI